MSPGELKSKLWNDCGRKFRLTPEEAAERLSYYPSDLHIYICGHCGYLHFGHRMRTQRRAVKPITARPKHICLTRDERHSLMAGR